MEFAETVVSTSCAKVGFLPLVLSRFWGRLQRGEEAVKAFSQRAKE
jgi:hypothetical protein